MRMLHRRKLGFYFRKVNWRGVGGVIIWDVGGVIIWGVGGAWEEL